MIQQKQLSNFYEIVFRSNYASHWLKALCDKHQSSFFIVIMINSLFSLSFVSIQNSCMEISFFAKYLYPQISCAISLIIGIGYCLHMIHLLREQRAEICLTQPTFYNNKARYSPLRGITFSRVFISTMCWSSFLNVSS